MTKAAHQMPTITQSCLAAAVVLALSSCSTPSAPVEHSAPPVEDPAPQVEYPGPSPEADQAYATECARYYSSTIEVPDIDVSDGIDRCEAQHLAEVHVGTLGCGAVGYPIEQGDEWIVPIKFGVAGTLQPPVRVNKRTGEIGHKHRANVP